jgi:GNAT superfamily N-acetyltransferase
VGAVGLREATAADVPAIVALLADDILGAERESLNDWEPYAAAFAAIQADANQLLMVAERDGQLVGTFQLSFIPGLSHRGATVAQVEGVRVATNERGHGLGTWMMRWAIAEAERRGCRIVQLTSHASRTDAHRFYEKLGFAQSHVGFKLTLDPEGTTQH